MKNTFLDFCRETMGYTFHSKKTGYQVYKFELYWSGLTPRQCFEKFDTKVIEFKYIFYDDKYRKSYYTSNGRS